MRNLLGTLGTALAVFAAVSAQAAGSLPPSAQRGHQASPACEAAQLSGWFDRQRQLTDGDVDPQKPLALPAECLMATSHAAQDESDTVAVEREKQHTAERPTRHLGPRG